MTYWSTGCCRNIRGSRRARGLHSDIEACAVMVAWVCSNNQLHPWKRLVNLSVDDGKMLIFILLQTVPGRYFGPSWWCLQAFFYTSGVPTGCHGTCSLKHLLTSRDSHISYYLCLSSLLAGSIKRHPTTFPCHLCHGRYWWSLALHIAMSNTSWYHGAKVYFHKQHFSSCHARSTHSKSVRVKVNFVTSLSAFIHSMYALSPIMNSPCRGMGSPTRLGHSRFSIINFFKFSNGAWLWCVSITSQV